MVENVNNQLAKIVTAALLAVDVHKQHPPLPR